MILQGIPCGHSNYLKILGVTRADLLTSIALWGSSFSVCCHKSLWIGTTIFFRETVLGFLNSRCYYCFISRDLLYVYFLFSKMYTFFKSNSGVHHNFLWILKDFLQKMWRKVWRNAYSKYVNATFLCYILLCSEICNKDTHINI